MSGDLRHQNGQSRVIVYPAYFRWSTDEHGCTHATDDLPTVLCPQPAESISLSSSSLSSAYIIIDPQVKHRQKTSEGPRHPPLSVTLALSASASPAARWHSVFRADRFLHPLIRAALAEVVFTGLHVTVMAQRDDSAAARAVRRFERRRVGQRFEVVFVGAVVDVYLGLKRRAALLAVLPGAGVAFVVVVAAQRVAIVVARARVVRK